MEEKLIEFVRDNPFLYSKKHRNYKNIHLRDSAFEELSRKINVPARRLKDRWRTLRDRFYKEIKLLNVPSRKRDNSLKKKWKFMDDLMFLKESVVSKTCRISDTFSIDESMFNEHNICSDSFDPPSPHVQTPAQTNNNNFSDDILDIMEDILGDVNSGISQVVSMAREVFAVHTERKTAAQLFFDSVARQTDEAKFSPTEFTRLQMEMLSTFNKVLLERQKARR